MSKQEKLAKLELELTKLRTTIFNGPYNVPIGYILSIVDLMAELITLLKESDDLPT